MADANHPERSGGRARGFRLPAFIVKRTMVNDVVQGLILGGVLAFLTLRILAQAHVTNVNGWTTMYRCGEPGNGILLRAACSYEFPGPINVPEEATYWTTNKDGAGRKLSGAHDYRLRFPPGGLPPNNAFWSLTMADARNRFVPNLIGRYSVSDRSGLVPGVDGSVDIYIQSAAPAGHESNWLPAPAGNFNLWLRAYLPDRTILDGQYKAPAVVQTR